MAAISGAWLEALKGEFKKPYYKKLFETVNQEYRTRQIFPPAFPNFSFVSFFLPVSVISYPTRTRMLPHCHNFLPQISDERTP